MIDVQRLNPRRQLDQVGLPLLDSVDVRGAQGGALAGRRRDTELVPVHDHPKVTPFEFDGEFDGRPGDRHPRDVDVGRVVPLEVPRRFLRSQRAPLGRLR